MPKDIHNRIDKVRRLVGSLMELDAQQFAAGEWDKLDRTRLDLEAAKDQLAALRRQRDQAVFERTSMLNAREFN